ncbi:MAG TPA: tyrosine-protein phosphatase [Bryobacteraceae bacterium]|nr:tyrosine-protein phosphatase [Bryobacteraceae bacterium]
MLKIFLAVALASGCAMAADTVPQEFRGVPNFHQVDDHVYRGAQPSKEGFENLAKIGIKVVIDLREPGDRSRQEEDTVTADGMRYIHVALNGYHAPSDEQIAQLLDLLSKNAGLVFIHCRRGADRTGTVIACYRIARENWPNEQALEEAKRFGMSWTEVSMKDYVRHFAAPLMTASNGTAPSEVAAQTTSVGISNAQ